MTKVDHVHHLPDQKDNGLLSYYLGFPLHLAFVSAPQKLSYTCCGLSRSAFYRPSFYLCIGFVYVTS
jgi:hypothetical protein